MTDFTIPRAELGQGLRVLAGQRHRIVLFATFACHSIHGPSFEFDRSFLRPSVAAALAAVTAALDAAPDRRALVFGHTDLAGDDAHNKGLSERRAIAVLAFLTHDVATWETLWKSEGWGIAAVQDILAYLGHDVGPVRGHDNPATKAAVRAFQAEHGLAVDGSAGPITRRALFEAYMQRLHPAPIDAARFPGFQAMGCSEFNPLVDTQLPDERNRRVVVFVFDPAVEPQGLPCKRGSLAPCHASFKPDKHDPRVPGFRCKVYDELTTHCGCEQPIDPIDTPIRLVTGMPTASTELVVLDGDTVVRTLPGSAAIAGGFELGDLDHAITYRLELRDPRHGVVAVWSLAPGPFRRAASFGEPERLWAAFRRIA